MKCRIMRHFIWVFAVCKSTRFGVYGLESVINIYSYIIHLLALCEGNIRLSYFALTEGQQFFFYYIEFLFGQILEIG